MAKSERKNKEKIRPKGTLSVSKIGTANIPTEIRDELHVNKGNIAYIVDAHSAILFNPDVEPKTLLESLRVLIQDIQLRIEPFPLKKKKVKK